MPRTEKRPAKVKPKKAINSGVQGVSLGRSSGEDVMSRRVAKTCEVVALEIVRDIVEQELRPGDGLIQEAEMLVRYRTSRASLREALRLLETQGLILIRPGRGISTVVGRADADNLARMLTLYLHMRGSTYDEVLEAWIVTEPLLAELAAKNKDRAHVRATMAPFLAEHAHGPSERNPTSFHQAVACLVENSVLSLSLAAVGAILVEHILSLIQRNNPDSDVLHDHRVVAPAIIAGDAKKAKALMEEHTRQRAKKNRAYWPGRVGERIEWR